MKITNTLISLCLLVTIGALPIDKRAIVTITQTTNVQETVTAGVNDPVNDAATTPTPTTTTPLNIVEPSTDAITPDTNTQLAVANTQATNTPQAALTTQATQQTAAATQAATTLQRGLWDILFGGSNDELQTEQTAATTTAATQAATTTDSSSQSSGSTFNLWSFLFGNNNDQSSSTTNTASTPQTLTASTSFINQATSESVPTQVDTTADTNTAGTGGIGILPASSSSSNPYVSASTADYSFGSSSSSQSSSLSTLSEAEVEQNSLGDSSDTTNKLWQRFWLSSEQAWNSNDNLCGSTTYTEPSLWNQAVVGRAVTNEGDSSSISTVISQLENYKNSQLGAFLASTAKDDDVYTDDNAQVAWVYIDAYKHNQNQEYLTTAQNIMNFIMNQTDGNGGVIWQYEHTYIALISTTEAALAAVRLYEITQNQNLITYAEKLMNFMFTYLQDPLDKLFYDGLHLDDYSDIDKGKLTYTVGTAISTLAYLHKYTLNDYWHQQAIELADAATNKNGKFYNGDGIWNNQLQYVHLLFAGFADLFSIDDSSDVDDYKQEVLRQALFVYNYLQDPNDVNLYFSLVDQSTPAAFSRYSTAYTGGGKTYSPKSSLYCPNTDKVKKSFMDNGSVAQILYSTSKY